MSPKVETSTPAGTPTPIGPYSHIAKVGEHITIGGTAGVDPATGQLAGPDVASQTRRILMSFRVMLESVGSDLAHVTHINIFLKEMADFEAMNAAYVEVMGDHRPARTVIGVNELPKPGVRLTMNLTAVTAAKPGPRSLVTAWVDAFNRADADTLAAFYAEGAINHQVAEAPVQGRAAIREMFRAGFETATMVCIVENIFEDGEWAILEWRDPLGLRGCGFFHVVDGRIVFQRGYWDRLTFLRQHHLPLPTA